MARNNIIYMKFCTNFNVQYHGLRLPKGAIYGEDDRGLWACYAYTVVGKSGYYRGMPRLKMWRKLGKHWNCEVEASPTTFGIMKKLYEHDQPPAIDWGNGKFQVSTKNIRKLRVVKCYGFQYFEYQLPKGAVYGEDEKGIFICKNYRLQGRDGYRQGLPCLEIWRPIVGGIERNNTTKWQKMREASATTWAIFDLAERENLELDYSDQLHKLAKRQDLKPERESVHYSRLFTPAEKVQGASLCFEFPGTLDDKAARQKGRPVITGYWD